MRTTLRTSVVALLAALALAVAGCGSDDKKSSDTTTTAKPTVTANPATVDADITAAMNGFLSGTTAEESVKTVCGASSSTEFINVYKKIKDATASLYPAGGVKADQVKATVTGDKATFTWALVQNSNGETLLPATSNAPGDAAFVSGTWCITPTTICDLSSLGAPDLAADCQTAAGKIKY